MVDSKVWCAFAKTSSSKCNICNATPKNMNNIKNCLMKPVDSTNYLLFTLGLDLRIFNSTVIQILYK